MAIRCKIGEFKVDGTARPMFEIRTDRQRDDERPWFSFGIAKAEAILEFEEDIREFVETNKRDRD